MVRCPTCGQDFDSEKGMKVHHKSIHGESIAGKRVECDQCGKITTKSKYRMGQDEYHFCSTDCRAKWRKDNFSGESNPNWRGGPIKTSCAWCDKVLEITRASSRSYNVHFCSVDCESKWKSEHKSGKNHPNWSGALLELTCDYCGDSFSRYQSHVREYTFCSPECRSDWLKENSRDKINYGPDWPDIRRRALEHYEGRCQRCGMTEEEHLEDYGCSLHIHHEIKVEEFDSLEKAHAPDNLKPLCAYCHQVVEPVSGGFPQKSR